MRRIEVIDSLRGIAILGMLIFHSSYYWNRNFSVQEYNKLLENPVAMLFLIFGKFAGIFALITGMAYAYRSFYKVEKQGKSAKSILKTGFISGLWIIIISKIQSIFFNHTLIGNPTDPFPTGPRYYSLITGSIQTGKIEIPAHFLIFYRPTALLMIGFAAIWAGILLAIMFRNDGYKKHKRNFIFLMIIGTSIILFSQVMKDYVRPYWVISITNDQIIQGSILGIFVGDPFPFFPFAGYATYGIMFGMAFYLEIDKISVTLISLISSLVYLSAGIYLYTQRGYPTISKANEMPEIQLDFIQISMMIIICMLIYNIHYLPDKNRLKKIFNSLFLRKFGLMTLTIFMLEPLVGWSIKVFVMDKIFGNWSSNLIFVLLFTFGLIIVWDYMIIFWDKINYVGSWEWIGAKIIQIVSGQPTMRMAIHDNLYLPNDNV